MGRIKILFDVGFYRIALAVYLRVWNAKPSKDFRGIVSPLEGLVLDVTSARFGAAVRLVIKATPISERDVAMVIGTSQPTLNRKIHGISPWMLNEVHTIGILFGIPPGVMIDHDPEKWRRKIKPVKIAERAVAMGAGPQQRRPARGCVPGA